MMTRLFDMMCHSNEKMLSKSGVSLRTVIFHILKPLFPENIEKRVKFHGVLCLPNQTPSYEFDMISWEVELRMRGKDKG